MKNNILLILVIIPLFLFITKDTIAFGYSDSEYKGKKPLIEKHISRHIGKGIGWVESCGRGGKARDLRDEIKFLSYADFRQINLGFGEWQSGGKYAIGCDADLRAISEIKKYIQDLKHRVNAKNKTSSSSNVSKDSKNKKTGSKSTYCKKLNGDIYETKRNYCTTSERISSKQEYERSLKKSQKSKLRYCKIKNGTTYSTYKKCGYKEEITKKEYDRFINSIPLSEGNEVISYCQRINGSKYSTIYDCGKNKEITKSQYNSADVITKNKTLRYCKIKNGTTYSTYKKCGYKEEITKKEYDRLNSKVITEKKLYCKNSDGEVFQMSYGNKCGFALQEITETEYEKIISGKKTALSLDCSTIPEAELTTIVNQAQCPNEIALRELERNKKTTSKGLKYCLGKKGTYSTFKNCSSVSSEITRQEYDSINNQPTFSIESMLKDLRGEEIKYYYTTANVRIRSQATIDSSILTTVPADQVVNVHSMLTSDNDWWLVEFNMIFGYMDKSYLSRDKMTNDSKIIDEKPINAQGYNQSDIFKERLKDLKELFDLDLITQQEYDQKKQSILDLL